MAPTAALAKMPQPMAGRMKAAKSTGRSLITTPPRAGWWQGIRLVPLRGVGPLPTSSWRKQGAGDARGACLPKCLLRATPFLFGRGCFEEKTGWIWSLALEGVALWLMFFNGRIQRMVGWRRSALSPCLFGRSPSPLSPFKNLPWRKKQKSILPRLV